MRATGALILAFGVALGLPGSALAVSGQSGSGDAAQAQYAQPEQGETSPGQEVLGGEEVGGGEQVGGGPEETEGLTTAGSGDSGGGSLPFTGYAALMVLTVGAISLVLGLFFRRRG